MRNRLNFDAHYDAVTMKRINEQLVIGDLSRDLQEALEDNAELKQHWEDLGDYIKVNIRHERSLVTPVPTFRLSVYSRIREKMEELSKEKE